jgi:hypothetical protein
MTELKMPNSKLNKILKKRTNKRIRYSKKTLINYGGYKKWYDKWGLI